MPTSLIAAGVGAWVTSATTAALGAVAAGILGGLAATVIGAVFRKPLDLETSDRLQNLRQPITPWQVIYGQTRVGGAMTYFESTPEGGDDNRLLQLVITLAGHEVEEIGDVYFNEEKVTIAADGQVTSGTYNGWAFVFKSRGDEDGQPFPGLVGRSAGKWTDAHRQSGRAKLYVQLAFEQDVYPNGIPKITAVVKGKKVYDPRTELTAWSANAALCEADYLTDTDVGLGCDYATEIDEDQLIAAANTCDEDVTLASGSTEKRYTMNGAFDANAAPRDMLGRLNTAHAGFARFIGGKWQIHPAAYVTPTITLTGDDLRGALHIMPRVSKRDLANGVKGLYAGPANFWQPTDFPPVENATYLAEDQDERVWRELDLPFTNSAAMAQRIAKIELERVRQQITVEWPGNLGCYRLQPGDTVMVTLSRYGWSAKVFEVVTTRLVFEEDGGEDGGVIVGCDLVLRETASSVFDWDSGEETEVDDAPDSNLPDAFTVGVPGIPDVSEALYETRDGRGVAAKAIITAAAAADAFVVSYQAEYRLMGASTWTVLPLRTSPSFEVLDIAPGSYDFRVKSINNIGVSSAYSTASGVEINGLTTAPGAPTGLSIQVGGGTARLKLDQAAELDVRRGGRVLVRFCHEGVVAAWESAFSIGEVDGYPGDATQVDLPLKPGTYLVKLRDSTGHESENFTSIETKQASVLSFSTLATLTFDSDFLGTHSGTAAADGVLTLGGTGLFDDIVDFDAVGNLDGYGGIADDGTWTAETGMDLGAVSNVRLTGRIEGGVNALLDQIDDRTGDVDDWLDWDGESFGGSAADAWLEVRETDDDPEASPVWSEWKRLDAAEFEARAFEFRARLKSTDPAYRPQISTLRVTAEATL